EIVNSYIQFYNTHRFQKRLGQLSPKEYREKLAA
ncbi:MAG: IS3 family transposase, partial [Pseudomonadota bacterium]